MSTPKAFVKTAKKQLPILSRAGLGDGVACGVTLCFGGAVYLSAMAAMGWHLEESKG